MAAVLFSIPLLALGFLLLVPVIGMGHGWTGPVPLMWVAFALFPYFSERGIAAAATVAGWLTVVLLFTTLLKRGHWQWEKALTKRMILLLVATAVMAGSVHFGAIYMAPWLQSTTPLLTQIPALLGLIGFAMAIYFVTAFAIGGAHFGMIRRGLKRKKGETTPVDSGMDGA